MAAYMDGNPAQRKKDFFSNSTSIVGVRYGKFSDHCLQNAGDEEKQEINPYVLIIQFLVACTRLYKSLCPSVGRLVCWSHIYFLRFYAFLTQESMGLGK